MEENKAIENKVEEVKKDVKTLCDEFTNRHIKTSTEGEGKEVKTYNPISADRELFARLMSLLQVTQEISGALSFLASEYEKKNDPNRIITKEDPEFKPIV